VFPPPPLKFRTAGFPQYGFKPNCPAAAFDAGPFHPAYRRPVDAALCPNSPCGQSAHRRAVNGVSAASLRSRGPWLASGLCCPAGSSLTMASSEPLTPPAGLWSCFVRRVSWGTEDPNFQLPVRASVPSALPRRIRRLRAVNCRRQGPSPCTERLGIRVSGQKSVHARRYFRGCTVRLMLRPGSLLALHRQGRLRSSFHPMSHLTGTSNITTRANSQFPRPDLHRQDKQPCWLHRYP
jgi:hypothetical protein